MGGRVEKFRNRFGKTTGAASKYGGASASRAARFTALPFFHICSLEPLPTLEPSRRPRSLPRAPCRLPRGSALLLLCAAYLMPGLLGRGPWKSADIAAFGFMAELARAATAWPAGSIRCC